MFMLLNAALRNIYVNSMYTSFSDMSLRLYASNVPDYNNYDTSDNTVSSSIMSQMIPNTAVSLVDNSIVIQGQQLDRGTATVLGIAKWFSLTNDDVSVVGTVDELVLNGTVVEERTELLFDVITINLLPHTQD